MTRAISSPPLNITSVDRLRTSKSLVSPDFLCVSQSARRMVISEYSGLAINALTVRS